MSAAKRGKLNETELPSACRPVRGIILLVYTAKCTELNKENLCMWRRDKKETAASPRHLVLTNVPIHWTGNGKLPPHRNSTWFKNASSIFIHLHDANISPAFYYCLSVNLLYLLFSYFISFINQPTTRLK